jgi:heme-degrading monooxygenase HmoA
MAAMIRATLRLLVRPGCEEEFEAAWREVSEAVRGTPGNVRQALLREPRDPRCYVITSDWETAAAFRSFERSPEQDALTARLRELRESAEMALHHVVLHVDASGRARRADPVAAPEAQQ